MQQEAHGLPLLASNITASRGHLSAILNGNSGNPIHRIWAVAPGICVLVDDTVESTDVEEIGVVTPALPRRADFAGWISPESEANVAPGSTVGGHIEEDFGICLETQVRW